MFRTPSQPPHARAARAASVWTLAVLVAVTAETSGCNKPTSDNIQLWKTTQKGPDRLRDALADHDVAPRLRAEAAAALVDIGQSEAVDTILPTLPIEDRAEIAKALIPLCDAAMKDPAPEKALAFRDALFSLRQFAPPDDQKRIDGALLPAIEADLRAGKLRQGRHSLDKMMTAIGPDAGAMLARVLGEPQAPYPQAAELLGKVGDEAAREKGASALLARLPAAKAAKEPQAQLLKAIGTVGGPSAIKFLEEKATGPGRDEAANAVRALRERRDPAVLPFALKVAGDAKADKLVRDEMFGVIEVIGGLEAQKGLYGIISSDHEEMVRYRAFDSALTIAKVDGIVPALEAFPATAAYKRVDVDDLLVKLIEKLGPNARPVLVKALDSRSPLARITAVMALEQMGRAPDAPALEKLAGDSTAVKGFPAGDTIGKEAARVAEAVKKKA
jgi:hypothetical protein